MEFNSFEQLTKYLQDQIQVSMNDVGEFAKEKVKQHLDTDVYSFEPAEYKRTYELRESVVNRPAEQIGSSVEVTIEHNNSLIHPYAEGYQHYSAKPGYTPVDYSPYVAETVEDGTSGKYFGEGFWTEPRPYMENAKSEMLETGEHVEVLKKSLEGKGFIIE